MTPTSGSASRLHSVKKDGSPLQSPQILRFKRDSEIISDPLTAVGKNFNDLVALILNRYDDPNQSVVSLDRVPYNLDTLKICLTRGAWKSLIKICESLTKSIISKNTMNSLRGLKILAMYKMHDFDDAKSEIEEFRKSLQNTSDLPFTVGLVELLIYYSHNKDNGYSKLFNFRQDCLDRSKELANSTQGQEIVKMKEDYSNNNNNNNNKNNNNNDNLDENNNNNNNNNNNLDNDNNNSENLGNNNNNDENSDIINNNNNDNSDNNNNLDEFFDHIQKLELDPRIWEIRADSVLFVIISFQIKSKYYFPALQNIQILLPKYENDIQFNFLVFKIYIQMGNISLANKVLNNISKIPYSEFYHKFGQGILEFSQGNFEESIKHFEFLKSHHNNGAENMAVINNLAISKLFSGNIEEALSILLAPLSQSDTQLLPATYHNCFSLYNYINNDSKLLLLKSFFENAPDDFDAEKINVINKT